MRPQLLILIDTVIIGGPGKGLFQLLRHLPKNAISYTLANFEYPGRHSDFNAYAREHDFALVALRQKGRLDPDPLRQCLELIRERNINLIQSHGYKTHLIAFLISRWLGIPWIAVAHGWTTEDRKVQLYHRLDRLLLRYAEHVIAVSPALSETLGSARKHRPPVELIYNAIDPGEVPGDLGGVAIRKACNATQDTLLIGVFGRLSREKGVDILLEAFSRLPAERDIRLLVVGQGPEESALKDQAATLGIAGKVLFHGHQLALRDYYEAIDMLVLPSRSEGLPNVMLEAMAFDVPVIATDTGAVTRVIENGRNGLVVQCENVTQLTEALQRVCLEPAYRAELSQTAKSMLFPAFSAERRAEKFLSRYKLVLAEYTGQIYALRPREIGKRLYLRGYNAYARARTAIRSRKGTRILAVLNYHRVNDEMRDAVTVGVKQFEWQMQWLAAHCSVVPLGSLLDGQPPPRSLKPLVAVTFDDGYKDNYVFAAPIMEAAGVPATFFVSTAIINTDRAFPHDQERLGRALPVMTWDDLRDLKSRGFEIGSHTANHVNCAAVSRDVLRQELLDSKAALAGELNIDRPAFAYPYGKKADATENVRDLVLELGYSGCCSAYGGLNGLPLNRRDIKRMGVDYRFNQSAFRVRILGYELRGESAYS